MTVAALILAAGQGRRFGAASAGSKLLANVGGEPLVRRVATTALASRAAPVVVVTGHAAPAVEAALAGLPIQIFHNSAHETGLASSLAAGLGALGQETTGALILLADMPLVAVATIDRLIGAFDVAPPGTDAVVPVCGGRQGNPVLIAAPMFRALQALRGDQGARSLLSKPGCKLALCPVEDRGVLLDVDTDEALAAILRHDLL